MKNQELCFVTNGKNDTVRWAFTPPAGTVKTVKDQDNFSEWVKKVFKLEDNDLAVLFGEIDTQYKENILDSSSASDADKVFSLIYNALLGDTKYLLTAYLDEKGTLTKVYREDYPQRTLDKQRFIEVVASIDDDLSEGMDAYKFLNDNQVFGKAEVFQYCYWNLREDKFYVYPSGKYSMSLSSADPDIAGLADTVIENPDKVFVMVGAELKDLDSFYKDSVICLDLDVAYLSGCTYVKPESGSGFLVWILIGCVIVLLAAAGALFFLFRKKSVGGQEDQKDESPVSEEPASAQMENPDVEFMEALRKIAEGDHPSAAEVLRLYDRHFKTRTRETFQNVVDQKADLLGKLKDLDAFKAKVQDGRAQTKEVLHEVDLLLHASKTKYEKTYDEEVANMGTYVKKYHDFVHLMTEEDVMANLDAIRQEQNTFPEIKTVDRLVKAVKKASSVITEQIGMLLKEADQSMLAEHQSQVRDAAAYARVGNVFRNNDTTLPHDRYLQSLVDDALGMDDRLTVDKYIEFAMNFRASDDRVDGQITSVAKAAKDKFEAIENALEAWCDATAGVMSPSCGRAGRTGRDCRCGRRWLPTGSTDPNSTYTAHHGRRSRSRPGCFCR